MKSILLLSALLLSSVITTGAHASLVTDTVRVTSMQCSMCERRINKELKTHDFISFAQAEPENGIVVVTYDEKRSSATEIERMISKIGYDTEHFPADPTAQAALPGCCNPASHKAAEADESNDKD